MATNTTNTTEAAAAKPKRTRAPAKPKPVYLIYKSDSPVEVVGAFKRTDDVLAALEKNEGAKYAKVEV